MAFIHIIMLSYYIGCYFGFKHNEQKVEKRFDMAYMCIRNKIHVGCHSNVLISSFQEALMKMITQVSLKTIMVKIALYTFTWQQFPRKSQTNASSVTTD